MSRHRPTHYADIWVVALVGAGGIRFHHDVRAGQRDGASEERRYFGDRLYRRHEASAVPVRVALILTLRLGSTAR